MVNDAGRLYALTLAGAALVASVLLLPASTQTASAQIDVAPCRSSPSGERGRACRMALSAQSSAVASEASDIGTARFQLHEIYHEDGLKVGEIYVAREPGAPTYVEHWVMFDTYEYPDQIRPAARQRYASEQDFLARVPFGPGYTYARWDVAERHTIPGR
jgi:hypothetical protein